MNFTRHLLEKNKPKLNGAKLERVLEYVSWPESSTIHQLLMMVYDVIDGRISMDYYKNYLNKKLNMREAIELCRRHNISISSEEIPLLRERLLERFSLHDILMFIRDYESKHNSRVRLYF